MTPQPLTTFDRDYLETWTETDPQQRRATIDRMWAHDGRLVISSIGASVFGIEDIAAHITRVHQENIVERGLRFVYDQHVDAEEALLLRWSMLTPAGEVAARGADVLFRDDDGRVRTAYMFMGVE